MLYVFPYARGLNFNICHTILMLAILNVISRMIFVLVKVIFNFSIFFFFFSLNTFDEDIFTTIFLQVLFLLSLCTFLYKKIKKITRHFLEQCLYIVCRYHIKAKCEASIIRKMSPMKVVVIIIKHRF